EARIEQALPRERIHSSHQAVEVVTDDKIFPIPFKGFEGRCRSSADQPSGYQGPIATCEVGILLGTRKGKLFVNDALGEHEPAVIEAGVSKVRYRGGGIASGIQGNGQAIAACIKPHGRWTRQNSHPVIRPDWVPIFYPLDVVPHAVQIDESGA